VGQSGELLLSLFTVEALDQTEDYLLFAAMTDDGQLLEEDTARRLFSLTATSVKQLLNGQPHARLQEVVAERQEAIRRRISKRNAAFFEEEAAKLDSWADDLKVALEREIKEMDRQIKEARRAASAALTLEEKLAGQKQVRALEGQRNSKRRALFDAQDEIDRQRERLIADIEGRLRQQTAIEGLFCVRWRVI
jgi:adenine-specific DNA-methyltransferase